MSSPSKGSFTRKTIDVKEVHTNIHQEVVIITLDKLRLILNNHLENLAQRKSWITPLGLLLTILTVFSTTSFKKAYFEAGTWEAFFMMAFLLNVFWLISCVVKACKTKSVSDVIGEIKNASEVE